MQSEEYKKKFHEELKVLMDDHVHCVYDLTKKFPREELYGVTSQLRRATLSIVLNYIEGYARVGEPTYKHFLKIAYGSLKESNYLLEFSLVEKYISQDEYRKRVKTADRIGAMVWGVIKNLN